MDIQKGVFEKNKGEYLCWISGNKMIQCSSPKPHTCLNPHPQKGLFDDGRIIGEISADKWRRREDFRGFWLSAID